MRQWEWECREGDLPETSLLVEYKESSVWPPNAGDILGNDHGEEISLDFNRVINTTGVASSAVIQRTAGSKLSNESKRYIVGDSDNW